jgi:hypothetical protein
MKNEPTHHVLLLLYYDLKWNVHVISESSRYRNVLLSAVRSRQDTVAGAPWEFRSTLTEPAQHLLQMDWSCLFRLKTSPQVYSLVVPRSECCLYSLAVLPSLRALAQESYSL